MTNKFALVINLARALYIWMKKCWKIAGFLAIIITLLFGGNYFVSHKIDIAKWLGGENLKNELKENITSEIMESKDPMGKLMKEIEETKKLIKKWQEEETDGAYDAVDYYTAKLSSLEEKRRELLRKEKYPFKDERKTEERRWILTEIVGETFKREEHFRIVPLGNNMYGIQCNFSRLRIVEKLDDKIGDIVALSTLFRSGRTLLLGGIYLQETETGMYTTKLEIILREFKALGSGWFEVITENRTNDIFVGTIFTYTPRPMAGILSDVPYPFPLSLDKPAFPSITLSTLRDKYGLPDPFSFFLTPNVVQEPGLPSVDIQIYGLKLSSLSFLAFKSTGEKTFDFLTDQDSEAKVKRGGNRDVLKPPG